MADELFFHHLAECKMLSGPSMAVNSAGEEKFSEHNTVQSDCGRVHMKQMLENISR